MSLAEFITEKNSLITQLFANKSNYADALMSTDEKMPDIVPPRQSLQYNPLQILDFFEYKSKPIGLSYDFLRLISDRDPLIAAIISTRLSQISLFTRPKFLSKTKFGFTFSPIKSDSIKDPEKKIIRELELMVYNCGFFPDYSRPIFPAFIKAVLRDRFRYDQLNFEITYNKNNIPVAFYPVDASTCRRYSPKTISPSKTYYQQIMGFERIDFAFPELGWGVYFPRTDVENFGYGLSEIEQILHILSSRIYADEYNANFLKHGLSKGILWAKRSTISRARIQSLREEITASGAGWYQAHRIPFLVSPDIDSLQYIPLDKSLRDMEFSKYLDYLLNLSCAVFQIDPTEINFPNRGGITGGAVVQTEGSQEVKIKFSRDKGLRPLLMFIEDLINQYIIFPLTNFEFCFYFYGLDDLSDREIIDKKQREISYWKTVNEIRREEGLPEIEEGNIILNTMFLQLFQQAQMATQFGGSGEIPSLHFKKEKPDKSENTESENTGTKLSDLVNKILGKKSESET